MAWGFGSIGIWLLLQIVLGIVVAVVFVGRNGGTTDGLDNNNAYQIASIVIAAVAGFGAYQFCRWRMGWSVKDTGIRPTIGFWRSAGWVVVAVITFSLVNAAWSQVVVPPDDTHVVLKTLKSHPGAVTIIGLAFGASILAPIGEELLFRGLLYRSLSGWKGHVVAAILSSAVFGALHVGAAPWQVLPLLAFLGFLFAMLFWRTGSLVPSIAMHAFINSQSVGVTAGTTDGQKAAWAFGITGVALVVIWLTTMRWRRAPLAADYEDDEQVALHTTSERAPWEK